MKTKKTKRWLIGMSAAVAGFAMASAANALPIDDGADGWRFQETFLGTNTDTDRFSMAEADAANPFAGVGDWAEFNFNLTATGDSAELYHSSDYTTPVDSRPNPSQDQDSYDTSLYQPIYKATVTFTFSEVYLNDTIDDNILFQVGLNTNANYSTLNQNWTLDPNNNNRILAIDLFGDYLNALSDGQFLALSIAPSLNTTGVYNQFFLDRVRLEAWAFTSDGMTPSSVPEPATALLFTTGLAGLAALRRKRSNQV